MPALGGMPCASAARKSSSNAQSGPVSSERRRRSASKRARCSIASVSSTVGPAGFGLGPAILFCPADRPDRYDKAFERADAVILDLEDAVARDDKAAAREALVSHPLDPSRVIVRVNAFETDDFEADLAALAQTSYRTVMLAKAANAAETHPLRDYDVIALCETAAGILAAGNASTFARYITHGYFSYVALNFTDTSALDHGLATLLHHNPHYHTLSVVPYGIEVPPYGQGTYVIWKYER